MNRNEEELQKCIGLQTVVSGSLTMNSGYGISDIIIKRKLEPDFSTGQELTDKERKLIISSVTAFHKGEHSEGQYFLKAAEKFAGEYMKDIP